MAESKTGFIELDEIWAQLETILERVESWEDHQRKHNQALNEFLKEKYPGELGPFGVRDWYDLKVYKARLELERQTQIEILRSEGYRVEKIESIATEFQGGKEC